MQRDHARVQLKQSALFGCMDSNAIDDIVNCCSLSTLTEGEVLFRQEQPAKLIFLLSVGRLKVFRTGCNGGEKVVGLIEPGSTFAESAIFSSLKQYAVSASALTESSVWCIEAEKYLEILEHSTEACFAILGRVTNQLFEQIVEVEKLTLYSATSRFAAYLLEKASMHSTGRIVVRLEAPKSIIASRLSIVPATFSRALAKLSRDGLLEVHDSEIHLLDIGALKEYVTDVVVGGRAAQIQPDAFSASPDRKKDAECPVHLPSSLLDAAEPV